jgi:hypothetical protein
MRTWSIPLAVAAMAFASAVHADEHEELRAAVHELKIVQRHLKAAPASYEGHRLNALRAVQEALKELRLALAPMKREKQERSAPPGDGGADADTD